MRLFKSLRSVSVTTPHMTRFDDALTSAFGGWQAALIAALQLSAKGISSLTFRKSLTMPISTTMDPRMMTKMIAIGE